MNEIIVKKFSTKCMCKQPWHKAESSCDLSSKTIKLEGGKVYAFVGEENKAWALPYTLAGHNKRYKGNIIYNGEEYNYKKLEEITCNIGITPREDLKFYKKDITGYQRLDKLCKEKELYKPEEIIRLFNLEESVGKDRMNRPIKYMGNSKYTMTAALGVAEGKSVFISPWISRKYFDNLNIRFRQFKRILRQRGAILIVSTGAVSESCLDIVDEIIYIR